MISNQSNNLKPQNLPEKIVWYLAIGTYPLYLTGSLYIVVPLVGAFFTVYGLWQWRRQTVQTPLLERVFISPAAWVWLATCLIIELAMIVAHLNLDLGLKLIVFTTVNNWYRRWAIIPMFIFGGHFKIRPQLMYRAGCIIALETATVTVLGTMIANLGVPEVEYVTPLSVFGGGEAHYRVFLFQNALEGRVTAFAPWATGMGILGDFFFFLAWEEKILLWRIVGIISASIMILASQSRAALVCIPIVLVVVWFLKNIFYPRIQLLSSLICFMLGLFSVQLINIISSVREWFIRFRGQDSIHSSRARTIIYRMTIKDWWNNAPIWGHGRIPETGPALVGTMPIGSHNTWLGGLYSFGLVGFIPMVVATLLTFFTLIIHVRKSNTAKIGLCLSLSLLVATFTDNVEFLNYTYWAALLFIGIALREPQEEMETSQSVTDYSTGTYRSLLNL